MPIECLRPAFGVTYRQTFTHHSFVVVYVISQILSSVQFDASTYSVAARQVVASPAGRRVHVIYNLENGGGADQASTLPGG